MQIKSLQPALSYTSSKAFAAKCLRPAGQVRPDTGKIMPVEGKHTVTKTNTETPLPEAAQQAQKTLPVVMPPPVSAPVVAPKAKYSWWIWAGVGLLAAGVATVLYLQPWATPVPVVTVETVVLGPVARVLAVNGRIAGVRSVDVQPLVSGTLVELSVVEGDSVTANQTLMQLDTAVQQTIVRQAVAGLDAALVSQEDAVATHSRTLALGKTVARVILDTSARAEKTTAEEVVRMTALLEQAQIELGKFTIRAPMAGTVLVLRADRGQRVDPATVLLSIADLDQLIVETDVDETYATQVQTGQPAALQLSGEDTVHAGHVSFVSQRVDSDTGGLAVKLTPDAALTAPIGLTVTANITVDDRAAAITIPRAAIVTDPVGTGVFLVTDGKATRRVVRVIDWPADRLIVTEGLSVGDMVISDATDLADGQTVEVAP